MKKTTRNILIMLAVLVVLGGAAALLLLNAPEPEEEEESSAYSMTELTPLHAIDSDTVKDIVIENDNGSFTLLPFEGTSLTGQPQIDFTIKGLEDYPLNTATVSGAAASVLKVNFSKELGQVSDLSDYGLAGKGLATITVHCKDGSSLKFVAGSTAGSFSGQYVLEDGKVYVVTTMSNTLGGRDVDYMNTEVYSIPDRMEDTVDQEGNPTQTQAENIMYHIEFTGTHYPDPIRVERDNELISSYRVTKPVKAESGTTKFGDMVTNIQSLTADGVEAVGVTEDRLEEYGLAEPFAQVDFDLNGNRHVLSVSEVNENGFRLLRMDGSDILYRVTPDKVSCWAELGLMDLRTAYICLPNIMNVEKITVTEKDRTTVFSVTRTRDEERSTEKMTAYTLFPHNEKGEELDYSQTYQPFYSKLISIPVLNSDPVEYDKDDLVCTVEYRFFDKNTPMKVEFYSIPGQERYAALLDGGYSGQLRAASLQEMLEAAKKAAEKEILKEKK